jgi:hypothetical protein
MTSRALDRAQTCYIPQPKFLEPGPRAQGVADLDAHWTTTLPEDLLNKQAIRLQLFHAVRVILRAVQWVAVAGGTGRIPNRG